MSDKTEEDNVVNLGSVPQDIREQLRELVIEDDPIKTDLVFKEIQKHHPGITKEALKTEIKRLRKAGLTWARGQEAPFDLAEVLESDEPLPLSKPDGIIPFYYGSEARGDAFGMVFPDGRVSLLGFNQAKRLTSHWTVRDVPYYDYVMDTPDAKLIVPRSTIVTTSDKPFVRVGNDWHVNLWNGFAVDRVEGEAKPFLDFVYGVFGKEQGDYLLKWTATKIQNPGLRPDILVHVIGPGGTGKSFFGDTIRAIFGSYHSQEMTSSGQAAGKFPDLFPQTLFVHIDEMKVTRDEANKFKSLITGQTFRTEIKNEPAVWHHNHMAFYSTSNHTDSLILEPGERRYAVLHAGTRWEQNRKFFGDLHHWMTKEDGYGIVRACLEDLDVSGFNRFDVPKTQLMADAIYGALQGVDLWWFRCMQARHILGEVGHPETGPVIPQTDKNGTVSFDKVEVFEAYKNWQSQTRDKSTKYTRTNSFWNRLMEIGAVYNKEHGRPRRVVWHDLSEAQRRFAEFHKVPDEPEDPDATWEFDPDAGKPGF